MSADKTSRIFLVDDDLDLLDMLSAYFQVQGYEVGNASSGEEALEAIWANIPDIALLDINLPGIDGYEICRRLRGVPRTQALPVIFLTEKREREDKLAGLELGAIDYLTKPFDIQELRLRVRNTLRRARTGTLQNPVTELPEGAAVRDRLEEMVGQPGWGLVFATIRGVDRFRDKFGFVAADDVSRAVALMIGKAVEESGGDDFIGHTSLNDFVVVTSDNQSEKLAERSRLRLESSLKYFYPALDRQQFHHLPESDRLSVRVISVTSRDLGTADVKAVFDAIEQRLA